MSWFETPNPLVPDLIAQNGRWLAERPALIDGACHAGLGGVRRRDRARRERPGGPRGAAHANALRC